MRPSLVRWLSEARSSAHWQKWIMQLPLRQSLDLRVLNRINAQRRLPLTYDRGRKMAQPERLTKMTGIKVYFTDPHSPWQRGSNENTNGLLRQYFPRRTDLSGFSQIELDAGAWQLNTRPRNSLGWKCPAELFMPDSFDFFQHHHQLVALRT